MYFELIKDFSGAKSFYDKIPCMPVDTDCNVYFERHRFCFDNKADEEMFLHIIYDLDDYCDAILDYGDVDYFEGLKLIKLKEWLNINLPKFKNLKIQEIFSVLLLYVQKAVELNTMVVIEA